MSTVISFLRDIWALAHCSVLGGLLLGKAIHHRGHGATGTHLLALHHELNELLLVLLHSLLLHDDDLLVVEVLLLDAHRRHVRDGERLRHHWQHLGHSGLSSSNGLLLDGFGNNFDLLFFRFPGLPLLLLLGLLGLSSRLDVLDNSDGLGHLLSSLNDHLNNLNDLLSLSGTTSSHILAIFYLSFVDEVSFLILTGLSLLLFTLGLIGGGSFRDLFWNNRSVVNILILRKVLDILNGVDNNLLRLDDSIDNLLGGSFDSSSFSFSSFALDLLFVAKNLVLVTLYLARSCFSNLLGSQDVLFFTESQSLSVGSLSSAIIVLLLTGLGGVPLVLFETFVLVFGFVGLEVGLNLFGVKVEVDHNSYNLLLLY